VTVVLVQLTSLCWGNNTQITERWDVTRLPNIDFYLTDHLTRTGIRKSLIISMKYVESLEEV